MRIGADPRYRLVNGRGKTRSIVRVYGRHYVGKRDALSADVAIEAARVLLTQQMATQGDSLVDQAIKDVGAKLN